MPPKNPQPGHPLAQAAIDEQNGISSMATPPAAVVPAQESLSPADPPLPASTPPEVPPLPIADPPVPDPAPVGEPPIDPRSVARLLQQNDTLLGRLDAESRARQEAEQAARAALDNREFSERRLQELADANRRQAEELSKLHADRDVATAVSGFKGEHVDPEAFGEIYRGLHPHLQQFRTQLETVIDLAVEKRVGAVKAEAEKTVTELRKELNEKAIQQAVPEFGKFLDRPDFKDFLSEVIPGARTSRRAEVLAAWREGDTKYIADVVESFKRKGAPRAVDNEPANHGRPAPDQAPRPPTPEPVITEDTLSAAFEQMNQGKITVAHYRKLKGLYDKQMEQAWRQSRRQ